MKRILILAVVFVVAWTAMAIPARRGIVHTLTLGDGSTVKAELRGDENFVFYVLPDGTPLVKNASGVWEKATCSEVIERRAEQSRARNERREVRAAKTRSMFQHARRVKSRAEAEVTKKKGIVILVNFNDKAFLETTKREYIEQMCNGEGNPFRQNYGSVHEYFKAQSYGQFDLEFDVVGPYTLTYGMTYYGKDVGGKSGNDAHPEEMVEEACKLADDDVDFQNYDWDGDGEVEQVYVMYAGYGQNEGALSNTIWPHEWDLASAFQYHDGNYKYKLRLDGMTINTYACGPELTGRTGSTIGSIGTICHEFSHCLGLPDFYDTAEGNYIGMDSWDVMDYGCYNGDGFQPAGYTAYERWFSGWLEPVLLIDPLTVAEMPAIQDAPVAYLLMKNGAKANIEGTYYLMYNHQQKGWDSVSYGHGMLVQYVRYNAFAWADNTVNNSVQRMTLIPGDGDFTHNTLSALAGDPWPGTSHHTSFSWDGHTVSDITEKKGLISFKFDGGSSGTVGISSPTLVGESKQDIWYDLNGRRVSGVRLSSGIYVSGGRKKLVR